MGCRSETRLLTFVKCRAYGSAHVYVRACVRARACVCVCLCVCSLEKCRLCVYVCVFFGVLIGINVSVHSVRSSVDLLGDGVCCGLLGVTHLFVFRFRSRVVVLNGANIRSVGA